MEILSSIFLGLLVELHKIHFEKSSGHILLLNPLPRTMLKDVEVIAHDQMLEGINIASGEG